MGYLWLVIKTVGMNMDESCPFIDDLPIKDGDFLYSYVKVPEGIPMIVGSLGESPSCSSVCHHFCAEKLPTKLTLPKNRPSHE